MRVTHIDVTNSSGDHINLTAGEAEELYQELCKLFGNPTPPLFPVEPHIDSKHWSAPSYVWHTNSCSYAGECVFLSYNGHVKGECHVEKATYGDSRYDPASDTWVGPGPGVVRKPR